MSRAAPDWFGQVRLLLGVVRTRSRARAQTAAAKRKPGARVAGYGLSIFLHVLIQSAIGGLFIWLTHIVDTASVEQHGVYEISVPGLRALREIDAQFPGNKPKVALQAAGDVLEPEVHEREHDHGGDADVWKKQMQQRFREAGSQGFVDDSSRRWPDPIALKSLTLLIAAWWLSLVLQGEGMNLDTSRRRHPMWEWHLGFPITQSAVFTAEALAPAVGNPMLLTAPVMIAVLVGTVSHSFLAGLCALPLGIPLLLAATLWSKALEVLVMLRSPPRNRGAWLAAMAMIGTVLLMAPVLLIQLRSLAYVAADFALSWLASVPSSQWLLDAGSPSGWLAAMATSSAIGLLLCAPALMLMRVASSRGLESGFGGPESVRADGSFTLRGKGVLGFLRDPLLRKDLIWLKRDHGALIQLFGPPIFLVAAQATNFRNILHAAGGSWNRLAGIVFFVGSLLIAESGPRTLLSEVPALQLTLSWPRGLEDVLRLKVRVLFALVTLMVYVCLGVLVWMFPSNALQIICCALLWPLFGLCIAEKAVTLIRAPSPSGELEPIPRSRKFFAGVGNSSFAAAIYTGLWPLVFVAIAMNWVFAGALWQNFRLRLAYLFDPLCEPELQPPTILSSVVAIVGMQELALLLGAVIIPFVGKDASVFAFAAAYAIAAIVASIVINAWQTNRFVYLEDMLTLEPGARKWPWRACLFAISAGLTLAIVGVAYQQILFSLPWPGLHDSLMRSARFLAENPNARTAYAIMAIGVAPWFEEFLFRGLMFRAMLPQWGLRRSVIVSAAFFAALHPWMAWPMVFVLGAGNALLYVRCKSLFPCILLHASYNAALLALSG